MTQSNPAGTLSDPLSCCRDPQVRGGKCENCDTWVSDDEPQAQQPKGSDSDDPGV